MDQDVRDLTTKVDDLAKAQVSTSTALTILVKEVQGIREDIKPMAECQIKMERMCIEHDKRGEEFDKCKADVAAIKQALNLQPDGTSAISGIIPANDVRATMNKVDKHDLFFMLIGAALSALVIFASGIGQRIVAGLLGL